MDVIAQIVQGVRTRKNNKIIHKNNTYHLSVNPCNFLVAGVDFIVEKFKKYGIIDKRWLYEKKFFSWWNDLFCLFKWY